MIRKTHKILSVLLASILLLSSTTIIGAETVDWKTAIPITENLYQLFEDYDEPQIMYTTTYVNVRPFPNIESTVKEVLKTNSEVSVISDYNGWSKIVQTNDNGVEFYYYIWNKYLSEDKVEIKTPTYYSGNYSSSEYLGNFTLTAYCNCSSCCGQWAGGATASGSMPCAGRTVAMGGISFGTKLLINGHVYTVEDRGTPYGHVDIYFNSHSEALQFGRQYADVYRVW